MKGRDPVTETPDSKRNRGLRNKLAGQVGEYLVCAEFGRRGLIATSFTGNVPDFVWWTPKNGQRIKIALYQHYVTGDPMLFDE